MNFAGIIRPRVPAFGKLGAEAGLPLTPSESKIFSDHSML